MATTVPWATLVALGREAGHRNFKIVFDFTAPRGAKLTIIGTDEPKVVTAASEDVPPE
jgi:hypothetical protein